MFPTTGQGACQSVEDAAALGVLLSGLKSKSDLPERLRIYESVRRQRAATVQAMSATVFGREDKVHPSMRKYLPGGVPFPSIPEHQEFNNS
jgi:salicylate hydroxylase